MRCSANIDPGGDRPRPRREASGLSYWPPTRVSLATTSSDGSAFAHVLQQTLGACARRTRLRVASFSLPVATTQLDSQICRTDMLFLLERTILGNIVLSLLQLVCLVVAQSN